MICGSRNIILQQSLSIQTMSRMTFFECMIHRIMNEIRLKTLWNMDITVDFDDTAYGLYMDFCAVWRKDTAAVMITRLWEAMK